jgi:hypothetical protein
MPPPTPPSALFRQLYDSDLDTTVRKGVRKMK